MKMKNRKKHHMNATPAVAMPTTQDDLNKAISQYGGLKGLAREIGIKYAKLESKLRSKKLVFNQ